MINKVLLKRILELEKKLREIETREAKTKKLVLTLKNGCEAIFRLINVNEMNKEKLRNIFLNIIANLQSQSSKDYIFNEKGVLYKQAFMDLVKTDESNVLFIFKLRNSNDISFALTFIKSKFTPFITIEDDYIIGVIDRNKIKEFEEIKYIPYLADGEYKEIQFFVVFFETEELNFNILKRALDIFKRFFIKPSFEKKHYVHYSLIKNQIIDLELLEIEKEKKEYEFLYYMKYPEIEQTLRREVKNIAYIFALLDRIDSELEEIKKSKGTIIVVKRILNFIARNQMDNSIQEIVSILLEELERD